MTLRRNFRSGDGLVDWYNSVFPSVFPAEDNPVTAAVSYASAVSAEPCRGYGSVHLHPSGGSSRLAEAEKASALVYELLESHADESVAVLVRGRTVLPELLSALREAGMTYRAVDIDRLTDLPEVIELLALTRAAVHPADRQAWLALLRSPWIGLHWQDLHALVRNDVQAGVWELLENPERLAALSDEGRRRVERAKPALAELRKPRRFERLRDVVERVWLLLGGPAVAGAADAIDNAYRLLDVIGRMERSGTLDDVAELEAELDQERVSSASDSRLSIMTMHKSKGLEFDHVVLYGLGRTTRVAGTEVMSWFELPGPHGEARRLLAPVGPKAETDKDTVHQYIRTIATQRDRLETARLLYVACTRAKRTLHLVGNLRVDNDTGEPAGADPRSLLGLFWPYLGEAFEAALTEPALPEHDEHNVLVSPELRRFDRPWELPPFADLPEFGQRSRPVRPPELSYDWVGSEARFAGTLVHRWLQRVALGRVRLGEYSEPAGKAYFDAWLDELQLENDVRSDVAGRVQQALETMQNDERGRWLVEGDGHAELSLTGVIDGELVTGVIDRVRVDGSTHWIVDYKTSSHKGGDLDGFIAEESRRYREQLERYKALYDAYAGTQARCALYFPLLGRFAELDL